MFTRHCWVVMLALVGCAGAPTRPGEEPRRPGETEDYGYIEGTSRVWVRGPWDAIRPSRDVDEVIDQLCPAIMELPGARDGYYGHEYCGAIYSLGDGVYYASKGSPLAKMTLVGGSNKKDCYPPSEVRDGRMHLPPIIADYHGHPWSPSPFSDIDLLAKNQRWLIRIQFDSTCHVQKLIPYKSDDRPGELYERQGKTWKLIGYIMPEDKATGHVTYVRWIVSSWVASHMAPYTDEGKDQ